MKTLGRTDLSGMRCSATFSDDEAYRYHLSWRWSTMPALVAWMLNPSTATHEQLDPTIGGLVKRARAWGYGGVVVVNLFALRATDPKVMLRASDPVGPDNDNVTRCALLAAIDDGGPIICGWGVDGMHRGRQATALALAADVGAQLLAFQLNQNGTPKHPLYVAHDLRPTLWQPA